LPNSNNNNRYINNTLSTNHFDQMNNYSTNQAPRYPFNPQLGNSNGFKRPHDFSQNFQQQQQQQQENWKKARVDNGNSSFTQRFDTNNIVSEPQRNRVDYRYIENKNVHNNYRVIENGNSSGVVQQKLLPFPPSLMRLQQSSIEARPFTYAKQ